MPTTLLETTYDGVTYQLDAAALVWPAAGALLGLICAGLALGACWPERSQRGGVISVLIGYGVLSLQALVAVVAWMPVERSLGTSRHVGSLFAEALWANLGFIGLGSGLAAFGLAFCLLHRPRLDPLSGSLLALTLLSLGLSGAGHLWGVQATVVGYPPELRIDAVTRFHAGQSVERQPSLGHLSTQGLLFKRTVWVPLDEARMQAWDVPPVTLAAPEPGEYEARISATRGPFSMSRFVSFEVGEDRGDPRFSPQPGDRWTYAALAGYNGSIEALFSGEEEAPEGLSTFTLRADEAQVVEGLRLVTLTRAEPEQEARVRQVYAMDGQTWLRVEDGEDMLALRPRETEAELEGLWACDSPLVPYSGCWCFEEGAPRQGVAFCARDTTDHAPSLIRGFLAIVTVGITEITGAMKGVRSIPTEAGVVLLPE
ncbi:MAG: hypothetical protein H6740_12355 [Alphaproteobacteria bacterium]|nr:hypothetical protein [Alphaproteobacteria bacterium]